MFQEQLKKILNLIKRTGDRVILFDASQPDDSYVLMDLDNYSNLVLLGSKHEMTNVPPELSSSPAASESTKINQEDELFSEEKNKEQAQPGNLTEEDLTDKINREILMWKNGENSSDLSEQAKARPAWRIPPQVKDKAQEVKD